MKQAAIILILLVSACHSVPPTDQPAAVKPVRPDPSTVRTLLESEIASCEFIRERVCSTSRGSGAVRCLKWWQRAAINDGGNAIFILNSSEPNEPFGTKYSGNARIYSCGK